MSKRFIDTGFLDQKWIRKLSSEKKIFLIYLMLKCDNGGIIDLDFEDASFWIGKKIDDLNFLPDNYLISLNNSGKYFMPKFIEWQYKDLSSNKYIVVQARQILDKYGLINSDFTLNLDKNYIKVTKNVPESQERSIGIGNGIGNGIDIGKGKKSKKEFIPPSLDEIKLYFKENGYSEESSIKAFEHYNLANWHDTAGKPVLNWKQKIHTVWFKTENKIKIYEDSVERDLRLLKESREREINGN